jgi:hypothetical protein
MVGGARAPSVQVIEPGGDGLESKLLISTLDVGPCLGAVDFGRRRSLRTSPRRQAVGSAGVTHPLAESRPWGGRPGARGKPAVGIERIASAGFGGRKTGLSGVGGDLHRPVFQSESSPIRSGGSGRPSNRGRPRRFTPKTVRRCAAVRPVSDSLRSYARERVLVTGGASFIGSHLVELLVAQGAQVTVADDFSSGSRTHLMDVIGEIDVLEGDLREPTFARLAADGAQTVFHLAALHGGRGYIDTHPVECTSNMQLDHVVFDACVAAGARRVVHASSACVYPTDLQEDDGDRQLLGEADANFDEPGKAFADGVYGWGKLMGVLHLRAFH